MVEPSFRRRATLLLSNLEEGREVRTYLRQFSKAGSGCFAVIKVGGALVARETEALGERLALLQALGLIPIVVFGSGPQLDARLEAAGISSERIDNLRVTPEAAIAIIAEEATSTGLALSEAIAEAGGRASLAPASIIHANAIDESRFGRVGAAIDVRRKALDQIMASGSIPLISCACMDESGRLLNVNADDVARAITQAVRPQKIVFLTSTGGLLNGDDELIDAINLESDYEALSQAPWIHSGMALKLDMIKRLLDGLPLSSSVSITTTDRLMKELFTHGGAGTLIRRGESIHVTEKADTEHITPLLEEAFGKALRQDYWDDTPVSYTIHTEKFRAAAIVSTFRGRPCLDKFAVSQSARGEGLAKTVWRLLIEKSPQIIWRTRQDNPFNGFYLSVADGFLRQGPWLILWSGREADAALLEDAYALAARKEDFERPQA